LLHQAELDSVEVSDADVIAYADALLAENVRKAGSKETLEAIMHKSYAQIRQRYIQQTREQQLMDGVRRKLTSNIKVTPAEVRDYFSKVPKDSLPTVPTEVEVQIITQQPKVDREEVERIEDLLNGYAKRVNDGEDFARLARMYSQDGSARNGGELGLSGRNQWVKPFADVAFSLNDPKKVSKIVKTEFGYHIIQLVKKSGKNYDARHILISAEPTREEIAEAKKELDSIRTLIKDGKMTFKEASFRFSDDKSTKFNSGIITIQGEDRLEKYDLPATLGYQIAGLNKGDMTDVFEDENNKRKTLNIVLINDIIPAHQLDINTDYERIKTMALNKKQSEVVDKWVKEQLPNVFMSINKRYKDCDLADWQKKAIEK